MLINKDFFQVYNVVLCLLLLLAGANGFNAQNIKADSKTVTVFTSKSAEVVLTGYIKAIGGKEKISGVKDIAVYLRGKIKSINVKYEIFKKVPDKFLQIIKLGGEEQKTVYNGKTGNAYSANQVEILSGKRLEILKIRAIMFPEFEYKKYAIVPELIGRTQVGNRSAFKLKFNKAGIEEWYLYFDEVTGLKLKEELTVTTRKGKFVQVTEFENYITVDGIKFPGRVIQFLNGNKLVLQVTGIEINTGLNNNIFSTED